MKPYLKVESELLEESSRRSEEKAKLLGRKAEYYDFQEQEHFVFIDWLSEGRFDDAITYVLYNYDRGGGQEWWDEIRRALENKKDIKRLHRLFRGLIPGRLDRYRISLPHANSGLAGNMAEAIEEKGEALRVLYEYFRVMSLLGEQEVAKKLKEDISNLFYDRKRKLPKPIDEEMSEKVFWRIIEKANLSEQGVANSIEEQLICYKAKGIKVFHQILMEHMQELHSWDLWAVAYISCGGCSDDAFEYFKAGVVSKGRTIFQLARTDIIKFFKESRDFIDMQKEELLYCAENAYFERQQKIMPKKKMKRLEPSGLSWDEEELNERYPEIWDYYNR